MIADYIAPGILTIDGVGTSLGASLDNMVSGTTTNIVIKTERRMATARLQCITTSSLALKVYVSYDWGVTFCPVISGSGGSSFVAADVAVVPAAGSIISWDCPGATHVKISHTAGSGTVEFVATPLSVAAGMTGALAILSALGINEDTAATDLEILMKGGSVRRDTPVTSVGSAGDWGTVNQGPNGEAWVGKATLDWGENPTTNRNMVEHAYTYFTSTTATTTVHKSGAGFIHTLNVLGGTLGAITVYDNTVGSGTAICPTFTPTAPGVFIIDSAFNTGLTIVTAAATVLQLSAR